eukprot:825320-Pelagomonas_calceolata.AAC.1
MGASLVDALCSPELGAAARAPELGARAGALGAAVAGAPGRGARAAGVAGAGCALLPMLR